MMTRRSFFGWLAAACFTGVEVVSAFGKEQRARFNAWRMSRKECAEVRSECERRLGRPEHVLQELDSPDRGRSYILMPDGVYFIAEHGAKPEKIRDGFV